MQCARNRCRPVRESFALPISALTLFPERQVDRPVHQITEKYDIPRRDIDTATRPRVSQHANTSQKTCDKPPPPSPLPPLPLPRERERGEREKERGNYSQGVGNRAVRRDNDGHDYDATRYAYASHLINRKSERWSRKTAREKKTRGRESKSEMETGSARRGRDTGEGSGERKSEKVTRAMPSPHVEQRTVLEREKEERERKKKK
ncbi:hypothetical protein X777_08057 [Ooceraea biroi]|uniref:Uncharacterized protein n=1 Tax=Ooceraea biroi TaxID=2015173 RepID=A0A026WBZ0_OOCBI|nr:hypothetical protein X777_08057 [Ooceraea biroi]